MHTKPNQPPSRIRDLTPDRLTPPEGEPKPKTSTSQESRPAVATPNQETPHPGPIADRASGLEEIETKQIPLELIDESDRLRLRLPPYRDIPTLAEDIRRDGQLAPLYVRTSGPHYELISGYRRLTALKLIGRRTAFCRIFHGLSDAKAYAIAIMENEDRHDLSDLERAQICLRLQAEGQTADEIATHFGWTNRRNVYHHYRLAKEASAALREALQQGQLALHVALALIDSKTSELGDQIEREILKTVLENEMSVRETRNHVARIRRAVQAGSSDAPGEPTSYIRDHRNGVFTIAARIDPKHPENLEVAIASVEVALKRMKHLKRQLRPKSSDLEHDSSANPSSSPEPVSDSTTTKKGA